MAAGSSLCPSAASAGTPPAARPGAPIAINLTNGCAAKAIPRLQRTRSSSECPPRRTPTPIALGAAAPPGAPQGQGLREPPNPSVATSEPP